MYGSDDDWMLTHHETTMINCLANATNGTETKTFRMDSGHHFPQLDSSSEGSVFIRNMTSKASGRYSCEVSAVSSFPLSTSLLHCYLSHFLTLSKWRRSLFESKLGSAHELWPNNGERSRVNRNWWTNLILAFTKSFLVLYLDHSLLLTIIYFSQGPFLSPPALFCSCINLSSYFFPSCDHKSHWLWLPTSQL